MPIGNTSTAKSAVKSAAMSAVKSAANSAGPPVAQTSVVGSHHLKCLYCAFATRSQEAFLDHGLGHFRAQSAGDSSALKCYECGFEGGDAEALRRHREKSLN